jgi:hypothetical protein
MKFYILSVMDENGEYIPLHAPVTDIDLLYKKLETLVQSILDKKISDANALRQKILHLLYSMGVGRDEMCSPLIWKADFEKFYEYVLENPRHSLVIREFAWSGKVYISQQVKNGKGS